MSKVSIIIPARNERYLVKTVEDLRNKAAGEIEIIVVLDGVSLFQVPKENHNIFVVGFPRSKGMRRSINYAAKIATGKYLLKADAHCMFDEGYDEKLKQQCDKDWVVVARRFRLDPESWTRDNRAVDYFYLSCPWNNPKRFMMQSCPWITRTDRMVDTPIDDLMCFQGSMWFMHTDYFGCALHGFDTDNQIDFAEHHEVSMKTWLGGGRVVINKDTWYAHMITNKIRGYELNSHRMYVDHVDSAKYWTLNKWEQRKHDFDWLIDKFWPLPTVYDHGRFEKYIWPDNWKELYDRAMRSGI